MPNWCEMEVSISGTKEAVEAVYAKAQEGGNKFSFENFMPTPVELMDEDSINGLNEAFTKGRNGTYRDWYSWRVGNWGTKWDLAQEDTDISEIANIGDVYFFNLSGMTAWSPALEIFAAITEQYPVAVRYKYVEEGMSFLGVADIENGTIFDDCRDIDDEDYKLAGGIKNEDGYYEEYNLMQLL